MKIYCFEVRPSTKVEHAWHELEALGCTLLYSSQEPDQLAQIFGHLPDNLSESEIIIQSKTIQTLFFSRFEEIDWAKQWELHGPYFHEGYLHLDLTKYQTNAPVIRLQPGPGFGDFSHPTTRLALELMSERVQSKQILDMGSGSGILSLAAVGLGAASVHGIDIDPAAVEHSIQNAKLNRFEDVISFGLAGDFGFSKKTDSLFIVMNMIEKEQREAWEALAPIHFLISEGITTGILKEDEKRYLELLRKWKWELLKTREQEGWLAFYFKT